MYHYTESGLQNIWLVNGFTRVKTKHGVGVSIHDVEGPHRLIGKALAKSSRSRTLARENEIFRTGGKVERGTITGHFYRERAQ